MMSDSKIETVDFLFIGLGASNSLLLIKMNELGLLDNKKIAIIEPNNKKLNNQNFCFWSTEEEITSLNLNDLIKTKWQNIKVADRKSQNISPFYYYHVKSIDLYRKTQSILANQLCSYYEEKLIKEPLIKSNLYYIELQTINLIAEQIFDSRPPSYKPAKKYQSHLFQSFYGIELKTDNYTFDPSSITMMDFNIPQNEFCQFIYVLPFNQNTALFEITRFGKEIISKDVAEKLLKDYLDKMGFTYQILDVEKGVIPMSNLEISSIDYGKNWVYMGSNANMIKSTTGYAFLNMAKDASKLAQSIYNRADYNRQNQKFRFKFYDSLLLKILHDSPQNGKAIFKSLFNLVSINKVLLFLGERSSLKSELNIFSKLPILIFLRVAFKELLVRATYLSSIYSAFFITIFSVFAYLIDFKELVWFFLGFGFLSIGLSHGALDYLTNSSINNYGQLFKFIIKYLIIASILGLVWIILPDLALALFIIFSAWHFGQTDFKEWGYKDGIGSFIWGLIVLIMILIYHEKETISVLNQIKDLAVNDHLTNLSLNQIYISKFILTLISFGYALYLRSKFMLLTLTYLLISSFLPLIVSFGIYFIIQHSAQGWKHLKLELKTNTYYLLKKALPFSLGAVFIFLFFMLFNNHNYFGIFFILLSCLSLPHIFFMNNFYSRFK